VCGIFVLCILIEDQLEIKKLFAAFLFVWSTQETDHLSKIITGKESGIFIYDHKVKHQSCEWCTDASPWGSKVQITKSQLEMLIAVLGILGIMHPASCIKVLKHLRASFGRIGLKNLATTGSCNMSVCLITHPSQCSSFWKSIFQPCPSDGILQVLLHVTSDFSQNKGLHSKIVYCQ
jgi:hypothetical protein